MPRFYFHIHDDRDYLDTEGTELPDEVSAHVEAIRLAGSVLRDEAMRVARATLWNMEVTDATGRPVYRIDLNLNVSTFDY